MRFLDNQDEENMVLESKKAQEINTELVELGSRLSDLEDEVHADEQALQDYKDEPSIEKSLGKFTTLQVSGDTQAKDISAEDITANSVSASTGHIDYITSTDITADEVTADTGRIDRFTADTISTDSVNAQDVETTNLKADSAIVEDLSVTGTLDIDEARISTFTITDATVSNKLTADKIEANQADIEAIEADNATIGFLEADANKLAQIQTHNIFYDQTVDPSDPMYIHIEPGDEPSETAYRILELPYFDTGDYYLSLRHPSNDMAWWSVIVHNNHNNITVSYSRRTKDINNIEIPNPTLSEFYVYDYFGNAPKLYIKTYVGGNLYWQNQSLSKEDPPRMYNEYPFDVATFGALQYSCLHDGATWFTKHLDIIRAQSAQNASLFLIPSDWNNAERKQVEYNGMVDISWKYYIPDQPVNTTDEVTFRNVIINPLDGKWVYNKENALMGRNPETIDALTGQLDGHDNLIETQELVKWNGKTGTTQENHTIVAGTIFRDQGYNQTSTHVYERRDPDSYDSVNWDDKQTRTDIVAVRRKSDWAIITSNPPIIGTYEDEEQILWTDYRYVYPDIEGGQAYEEWIERTLPGGDLVHKLLMSTVDAELYINYTRFKEPFEYGDIDYNVNSYNNYHNQIEYVGDVVEGRWDAGDVHVTKKSTPINSAEPDYNGSLIVDGTTNLRDNVLIQNLNDPSNPEPVAQVNIYADDTALIGGDLSVVLDDETAEITSANIVYGKEATGLDPAEGGLNLTTNNDSTITLKGDTNIVVGTDPLSYLNHDGKLTITYSDIEFVGHKSTSTVPPEEVKQDPHVLFRDDVEIGTSTDRHNIIVHGKVISDAVVFSGNEGDNMRIRNLGTIAEPDMNAVAEPCAEVTNTGKLVSADSLITADKVGLYNGTVANNYTDPTYDPAVDDTYPIIHLGDNTTVHGDIHVTETAQIDGNTTIGVPAAGADPAIPANLEVVGNATVDTNLVVEGTSDLKGDTTIGTPSDGVNPAIPADLHVTGETQHDGDVILGTGGLTPNKVDLYVNGDIYQYGSSYETHAEQLFTTKDHIIMRDGAVSGLITGEHSGLQVMNYDGSDTQFHLCIGRDGYGRVGDTDQYGVSVSETYSYQFSDYHLYKDEDSSSPTYEHYFDDKKLEIEHNFYIPTGATNVTYTETAELDEDDEPTGLYTVTMEYDLTGDSLQKILTIEEAPQDQSLLYWDGTAKCSRTLIKPATIDDDKALVPVYNGSHIEYRKYISGNGDTGNGSVFVGTSAELQAALLIPEGEEGYLPNNAVIILTDADNTYLHGEDQVITPEP